MAGIAAARARTEEVDALVREFATSLDGAVALVALGSYGRFELTANSEVDLLFLHEGSLSTPEITQTVCYPLWERAIRVESFVRTVDECAAHSRRSWNAMSRFLDARLVAGSASLFRELEQRLEPLRRDREHLRNRLRAEVHHRHTTHPSVTAATAPDLVAGRGGLLDVQALRWLGSAEDQRTTTALDALLTAQETGNLCLDSLYGHARWLAFHLDNALARIQDDRQLGSTLMVREGELTAQRPPPLDRAPALGLRVANLVGLAPPSNELLEWAQRPGGPLVWDETTLHQFLLLLRAADWRAWDFLDVSGLLTRYIPEFSSVFRRPGSSATGELAIDYHSFLALRRLHEWTESEDLFAARAWRLARHHDWVYLAVLLHELEPNDAMAVVRRLGLPEAVAASVEMAVSNYGTVIDIATRRDLHEEELVLELATRIGSRQRLGTVFLVAVAHEMASGSTWSAWKANLVRQLFAYLDTALREPREVGASRTRSLEQHRERIVDELTRRNLYALAPMVAQLPRRYVLTRSPAFAAHHLSLLADGPLGEGEVRVQHSKRHETGLWDLLIVARDRPGLLATVAGVLALRGASVLAADAATSSAGLVLDVFTVKGPEAAQWQQIEADFRSALRGSIPLEDLLGSRPVSEEEARLVEVSVDNTASQFFNVVEVRAPDQVGLLYRIASALSAEQLDIHHARIATHPDGALDVFYVRGLSGDKLPDSRSAEVAAALTRRLRSVQ